MRTFIIISFLITCVLSHNDHHKLPYGGAILRRNGEFIPGKYYYRFHVTLSFIICFTQTELYVRFSGAISCIWTKIFEDMEANFADGYGSPVFQNMKKYLNGIDLALQNDNIDDLLPLLKKYQAYLKESLLYIHDRDVQAAICEIIKGNVKVEQDFTNSGLDMNALNVYVKHSAVRLNGILIANKRH